MFWYISSTNAFQTIIIILYCIHWIVPYVKWYIDNTIKFSISYLYVVYPK